MKDTRSLDQSAQAVLRIKAVTLLRTGLTQAQVAGMFGVTRQAVGKWWALYQEGGTPAFRKKSRRPQSTEKNSGLTGWQCASIVRTILRKALDQLHFPFMLWTRAAVGQLIGRRFQITLSKWTVGRLLKHWGMTP